MNQLSVTALMVLAEHAGIISSYKNAQGNDVHADIDIIIKVLMLLGFNINTVDDAPTILAQLNVDLQSDILAAVTICWQNQTNYLALMLPHNQPNYVIDYIIYTDNGEQITRHETIENDRLEKKMRLSQPYWAIDLTLPVLSLGYHRLRLTYLDQDYDSLIISAPSTIYTDNLTAAGPCFGLFAPLYALRDASSIGCGDLNTFRKFAHWAADQGASVIATMPFFAAFLESPCEPSPYSPVSRLFWNELYLDVNDDSSYHCEQKSQVNAAIEPLIDYYAVNQIKRRLIIEQIKQYDSNWLTSPGFQAYLISHPKAKQYALFRAYQELTQQSWHAWPTAARQGELTLTPQYNERYLYHLFSQWQFDLQLNSLRKELNEQGQLLYLDLPIGTHGDGFDVWHYQDEFINGATIGAPPDLLFTSGQNWGMPPLNPLAMKKQGYRYFIDMIQQVLPYVDILRIDHVMGFNRLFWILNKHDTATGVYIRYPAEDIYAILCLESHRFKTAIVGENLGSVPVETNTMMAKHHVLQMYILQYLLEANQPFNYPKFALASLNTHDMPTFASYINACDLTKTNDPLNQIRLVHRQQQIKRLTTFLTEKKLATMDLLSASLTILAKSPALIVTINVEDLWHEILGQNNPGALDEPNWRRKFAFPLEQFDSIESVTALLKIMRYIRPLNLEKLPLHCVDAEI